jgi:quercetin dioxygenase-like cupin family protein
MAIRLVHLYTGDDGESHFTDGAVDPSPASATTVSFEESAAGSSLSWHNAPVRQYVITLRGTLEFETRLDERFTIAPGDVLLAEDTTGGGHRWRLVDDQPWRRVYVELA